MIAAPASAAAIPSAMTSAALMGIFGWRVRPQAPFNAASIHTFDIGLIPCILQRLTLVLKASYCEVGSWAAPSRNQSRLVEVVCEAIGLLTYFNRYRSRFSAA